MRIQRFIEIKKLLFIHSILSRDEFDMVKVVFINRAKYFFDNIEICESNEHGSPVYDMLNIAINFGIIEIVKNMVYRGHLYSRADWRERIWKRAWELEEVYWCIEARCHKSLELINKICVNSQYLVWWQISDRSHYLLKECEIMAKLLCHASLLRTDDVRLKRLPVASRFCPLCDHSAMDDTFHMVMQCPFLQDSRTRIFHEIERICDACEHEQINVNNDIFLTLMGKPAANFSIELMIAIWECSARHIANMYLCKLRTGIG